MDEFLDIKTVFTIHIPDGSPAFLLNLFPNGIAITETVVVSWGVMALLIGLSFAITRNLKRIPTGAQAVLEAGIEFLNAFSKNQFGKFSSVFAPYVGTLFLFLLFANIIGVLTPIEAFGFTPLFEIKPPTRDMNVTAPLACLTILLVIVCNIKAKGIFGWLKHFLRPVPFMLPFNILEYGTRILSLALRLFGNILGGLILMHLIEGLIPVAAPMVLSLYFDFFDGFIQAAIFTFLSVLYISEALEKD
ncbi:MAG: F0F1 ATP synthase subunit A [Treponema sp.]|jgi:F-type H+-transporting ATPase subunit a|nr:F0F1 ATP synthase subunit A [Treponema sp.]